MSKPALRTTVLSSAMAALVALVAPASSHARPADAQSASQRCPSGAASFAADESGFTGRAERYWNKKFGGGGGEPLTFSVWRPVCGDLNSDGRADMAVSLILDQGTGGSPRPWAVFTRASDGEYVLRRAVVEDRYLLCRLGISKQRLFVRSIARYEGAFSKCNSVRRYRLKRGRTLVGAARARNGASADGPEATTAEVHDCNHWAYYPNLRISSARNMSCRVARGEMRRYKRPIYRAFTTPYRRFRCVRVSGMRLGGQWRCTRGSRAFRFDFGD